MKNLRISLNVLSNKIAMMLEPFYFRCISFIGKTPLCVLILSMVAHVGAFAQKTDSIPSPERNKSTEITSIDLGIEKKQGPKVYKPKTALLWAIVPGGGQVYNRRWWKVPLVFSAFSGTAAVWNFNQSNYKRFNTAYNLSLAGKPHEFTNIIDDTDRLKGFRDGFNKSRQTTVFYMIAIYGLQAVEAYVDSQLRNFDIDDDLSQFQIQPIIMPSAFASHSPVLGLELKYHF